MLLRIVLYGFIIFLISRMFFSSSSRKEKTQKNDDDIKMPGNKRQKRVKKDVGEYVDFEEVKKEE